MNMPNKTYDEMTEYAKSLHPDAKVRKSYDDTWEIVIETDLYETYEVSPSWAGTHAEEAFNTPDSHGDLLTRWANKNGYSDEPLDLIAERYNIIQESQVYGHQRLNEELIKRGYPDQNGMFEGKRQPSDEEWAALEELRDIIGIEMTEKFQERTDALNKKLR